MDKERIKSIKAMMEIAIIAMGREKNAYDFYLEASKEAYDEESKNLLVSLANQEKAHLERMEKLFESTKTLYEEEKKKY